MVCRDTPRVCVQLGMSLYGGVRVPIEETARSAGFSIDFCYTVLYARWDSWQMLVARGKMGVTPRIRSTWTKGEHLEHEARCACGAVFVKIRNSAGAGEHDLRQADLHLALHSTRKPLWSGLVVRFQPRVVGSLSLLWTVPSADESRWISGPISNEAASWWSMLWMDARDCLGQLAVTGGWLLNDAII